MLGHQREQLLGRTPFEVFPDLNPAIVEAIDRALTHREFVQVEVHHRQWARWYENRIFPTNDGGVAIYWRDVTEQKLASAKSASDDAVLQQVHNSIITTDLNGTVTGWNQGAQTIFGYPASEIVGQSIAQLYFPEDRASVRESVLQPLLDRGYFDLELRNRRSSGEECFVRLSLSLLRDVAGEPYAMLGVATDITEQTLAARALRESEARFRSLANVIPQIAYITSPDGRTTFINDQWGRVSGAPVEASCDLNWMEWIHPDDLADLQARWRTSLASKQPFDTEYRVRDQHGEYRWYLSRAVPVTDPSGVVLNWVGTLTDIHASRLAAAAQRTLTEQLRLAIKATGAVVYDLDLATSQAQIRGDLEALLGKGQDQSTNALTPWSERMHPDDVAHFRQALDSAIAEGRETYHVEYRTRHTDGRWICLSDHGLIRRDADGTAIRAVGTLVDITSSHSYLKELRSCERYLGAIGESVVALDSDLRVRYCNEAAVKTYGLDRKDIIGKPYSSLGSDEWPNRAAESRAWQALADQGHWSGEYTQKCNDGRKIHVAATVNLLPADEGGGMVAVFRDISERKQMEMELERRAASLERANLEWIHCSHAVAHDLKAPLRNVSIFAQLLRRDNEGTLDPESLQHLDFIVSGAKRLGIMLDDLMLVATASGSESRLEPIPLAGPIQAALHNLVSLTAETGCTVAWGDLPTVLGDASQLTQVFQNLIANSIKYRKPDTPPTIIVTAAPQGAHWLITLTDNGIGFEPHYGELIFGVFSRLNGVDYEGSGVGLAICKRIIERHGGEISATGRPNQGAQITFTLQAAPDSK
jgi:PAS domain S-box-containing protein